jgi:hypothetical protein
MKCVNPANVKLSDVLAAFEWVSAGYMGENSAYISRQTGEIRWSGDPLEDDVPTPEDMEDDPDYIAVPHKNDLDLGRQLALSFAEEQGDRLYDEVRDMFRRKGAYRRFKDRLDQLGMLAKWYEYEEAATMAALREWCADSGLKTTD